MREYIREILEKHSEQKYREFSSSLIPNSKPLIGVRLPELRKLAKELVKKEDWRQEIICYDGEFEDVYFASPCELYMSNLNDDDLEEYVKNIYNANAYKEAMKYEKLMQVNNMHYEIDCPQVEPFLPDEIEIVNVLTESECVKYLLHNM